jgi:hypothetical protein
MLYQCTWRYEQAVWPLHLSAPSSNSAMDYLRKATDAELFDLHSMCVLMDAE